MKKFFVKNAVTKSGTPLEKKTIRIELDEQEARAFINFRKDQDFIERCFRYRAFVEKCLQRKEELQLLEDNGVFDFRGGHAAIHRDENGIVRQIVISAITFRK